MIVNGFDWDEGNTEKCRKHGVPTTEIEEVFDNIPMILLNQNHESEEIDIMVLAKENKDDTFLWYSPKEKKMERY